MLRDLLLAYSVQDLVDGISPEGAAELLAAGRDDERGPRFYARPESGRWFVCLEGTEYELCECFAWETFRASEVARIVAMAMNDRLH